jgi:hypothetical protein
MVEDERRRSPRYSVHGFISFGGDRVHGNGQVYNVSATGCAVGTRYDVPLGSHLRISLQLGDVDPVVIDTAVVRWVHRYKFGMEFLLAKTPEVARLRVCLDGLQGATGTSHTEHH